MIVTLTGPSCAGKTTLKKMLTKHGFVNAISTTTRPKREGDVDGESYYFTDRATFEHAVRTGMMVEHVEFGGNYYGLSVAEVQRLQKLGKPIVVVCEPIGQKQIAAWCKDNDFPLYAVFVDNPEQVIAQRFLRRFADELMAETQVGSEVQVPTYARRLKEMMTTERGWVAEAWSSSLYDLRPITFDETNDFPVVGTIVAETATRMMGLQPA